MKRIGVRPDIAPHHGRPAGLFIVLPSVMGRALLLLVICMPLFGSCSVARCSGMQTPCGYLSTDMCAKAPECSLITGCADIGATNCGILDESECSSSSAAAQCYWEHNTCMGPCDMQSEDNCSMIQGCKWSPCTGHVKPCSSYGNNNCPVWNGCYLEGLD